MKNANTVILGILVCLALNDVQIGWGEEQIPDTVRADTTKLVTKEVEKVHKEWMGLRVGYFGRPSAKEFVNVGNLGMELLYGATEKLKDFGGAGTLGLNGGHDFGKHLTLLTSVDVVGASRAVTYSWADRTAEIEINVITTPLSLALIYNFGERRKGLIRPYLGGGLSLFSTKFRLKETDTKSGMILGRGIFETSKYHLGLHLLGGINYFLTERFFLDLEGRFQQGKMDFEYGLGDYDVDLTGVQVAVGGAYYY